MRIGVLAIQGAFIEHEKVLARLGVETVEVRLPGHLEGLDGLIIPGGESTTIGQVAQRWGLLEPIRTFAQAGRPVWGTCAGMILLASRIEGNEQWRLGLMDMTVKRNAFGRQVDSFEADLEIKGLAEPVRGVFIRAPYVTEVGEAAEALCTFRDRIVAVRQGKLLATAFHPELTADRRMQEYFVEMTAG